MPFASQTRFTVETTGHPRGNDRIDQSGQIDRRALDSTYFSQRIEEIDEPDRLGHADEVLHVGQIVFGHFRYGDEGIFEDRYFDAIERVADELNGDGRAQARAENDDILRQDLLFENEIVVGTLSIDIQAEFRRRSRTLAKA